MVMTDRFERRHPLSRRRAAYRSPSLGLLLCVLLAMISVWIFSGCGNREPRTNGHESAQHRRGLPALGRPIPVAVENASRGTIASYHTTTGTLEPNKQAEILARVSGIVLKILAEEGDTVDEGGALLRIEEDEYRARLKEAEAAEAKEQRRFERVQKMFRQGLTSAEDFEATRNDLLAAESARELAALQLSYTKVQSPFRGRVVRRLVDPGQTVNEGTSLFEVADLERLLARVHVPAKEFRNIRTDQPVELTIDSSQDRLVGRITLVSPIIDPTSGTIKVTIEITDCPPTTRPGDFAEVKIVTDQHSNTLLVPKTSVITDKGEQIVYVAADSTARRRVVEIGFQDDRRTEILSGLDDSDLIVVQGQRSLKDGQPLRVLEKMVFEETRREKAGS